MSSQTLPHALNPLHPRPLKVLIPLFHNFNTFDANGPIEILTQANRKSTPFKQSFAITITAAHPLTTSIENVRMERDISFTESIERLEEWDILLVPGGVNTNILEIVEDWKEGKVSEEREIMRLIERYSKESWSEGLTLTVCTGSLFLAGLGLFAGRTATTHWGTLPQLKKLCNGKISERSCVESRANLFLEVSSEETKVVRARWVDSERDEEKKLQRVITAGGVSCGLDATFHLLDLTVGSELAETVAKTLDYQRRGDELQENYEII